MTFKFVAFTRLNLFSLDLSLLFIVFVSCNFVSGICKLKLKKLKTYFFVKNPSFFSSPGYNTHNT